MAGDRQVRGVIRLKLGLGTLPKSPSGRVWAGPGANEVCSACDETISRKQRLHEWEYADDGKIVMHVRCWEIWNEERVRPSRPAQEGGDQP